ncbi:MAG TPA: carboxypeptidase-like regulatory domain-containing protein [Clostridia bacterium]|nr:carboxypeptidase-like regulatory domain-containing protein [Clostridia bacterium]
MQTPRNPKHISFVALCLFVLVAVGTTAAQSITGTVNNGSTGKPAAGVDVALVNPMQGMAEIATVKSDAQGRFTLPAPAAQGPHLVRVGNQGVNYFKMLTPGITSVNVEIYDGAAKLDGITGTVNVIRLQADEKALHVLELYAVKNGSTPPRTLISDQTFEVELPQGATEVNADAQGPNGQAIAVTTAPGRQKNRYVFSYPLKPGETRFQISYHLPYNGSATLTPRMLRDYEHVVVVMPSSMQWEAKNPGAYRPMQDEPDTVVQVAANPKPGDDLSFNISGRGMIKEHDHSQDASAQGGAMGETRSGPGGGLGKPIGDPDALDKYRWPILALLMAGLGAGALFTMRKGPAPASASAIANSNAAAVPVAAGANPLLDGLKEELFQLEMERQRGEISADDYSRQKAALDQTLARAVARNSRVQNA